MFQAHHSVDIQGHDLPLITSQAKLWSSLCQSVDSAQSLGSCGAHNPLVWLQGNRSAEALSLCADLASHLHYAFESDEGLTARYLLRRLAVHLR